MPESNPTAVEAFIERMGLHAQGDGLPRIAGRMLGYFIVHGGPASLAELARTLQVSRASVSTNARVLVNLGAIERTSVPGDRQDYYRLAPQPYARILEGYLERMRRTRLDVAQLEADLPADWAGARTRITEMRRFYDAALDNTERVLEALAKEEGKHR
ncbi:GbsR/MarR family transcriptional regulator [Spectribacter hydrogenooxidans]|uniref:MarR family transcriptional regulator n=1 Tax=Spectribacter hydrogenoxidans TaxID=3075608 RepID=A0ABU3BYZ0_9GAMM|nr:MarR family transcriptional regulator [Salinisphaera sp. W335]MDT0634518.1 MarR family transcriptional regulator [Salinisphaera sp. W335]